MLKFMGLGLGLRAEDCGTGRKEKKMETRLRDEKGLGFYSFTQGEWKNGHYYTEGDAFVSLWASSNINGSSSCRRRNRRNTVQSRKPCMEATLPHSVSPNTLICGE